MTGNETRILAGTIVLDKFGERLFLNVRSDMRISFDGHTILGGHTIRVLGADTNFENEIFAGKSADVSVAARLATLDELQFLAPSQLSDPTVTAKKIARFEAIQNRAFQIFEATGGSADSNWLRAERELLAL